MTKTRPEQELRDSIRIDSITSSYSLEGRSPDGVKTSSFLSYTSKCKDPQGWTLEEARYVEACLAQQVVEDLYTDAFVRQQISKPAMMGQVEKLRPLYDALRRKRARAFAPEEAAAPQAHREDVP